MVKENENGVTEIEIIEISDVVNDFFCRKKMYNLKKMYKNRAQNQHYKLLWYFKETAERVKKDFPWDHNGW